MADYVVEKERERLAMGGAPFDKRARPPAAWCRKGFHGFCRETRCVCACHQ